MLAVEPLKMKRAQNKTLYNSKFCRAYVKIVWLGYPNISKRGGSIYSRLKSGRGFHAVEEDGEYLLDVWIKTGGEGSTFGGQGR